jgi:5-methylcytosine-specific restriction enzyme subunit McrC
MAFLFEYGNWLPVINKADLKKILIDVWQKQFFVLNNLEAKEEYKESSYQPFLQFDGDSVKANNYIGFIQNGQQLIEIYPKVFREDNCQNKPLMLHHIFYWFSYCRKWRFPFNEASLSTQEIKKFPELIIHLISNQFYDLISKQPLMQYQILEESLYNPRGNINFNRYARNSLGRGLNHRIECDYEPFLYDNKVNRVIKYCARLLMGQTSFSENIQVLQETLFILDEVEDIPCTLDDINSISLNIFYSEYMLLLESCKLIISQQLYSNREYDISQWCLLFPMEYIFEDFIAGFIEKHFSNTWDVKYQKSDEYLSNKPQVFNMQHDIFLKAKDGSKRELIIDTKYKIRDKDFKNDPKKGVNQSDLYQMVSYAYKRGCNEVLLIYPNTTETLHMEDVFEINSGFNKYDLIKVSAIEVPFWTIKNFSSIEKTLLKALQQFL